MHKLIFYPVGNGDTSQILLENGRRILFDFRHQRKGEDEAVPTIDLQKTLSEELKKAGRDYFDVVAFTHADKDHISLSTEFFELLHAKQYQGEGRVKIKELWVPAAMIVETAANDEQSDEFVIWRQEARHRLIQGQGIQVFSKPEKLRSWLDGKGIQLELRNHLIVDAGSLARGFSLATDKVEFFCHSPFIKHVDEAEELRNEASLIFQVRFELSGIQTNYLAIGDSTYDVLEDIVRISDYHKNADRLGWHIFSVPHHCSANALGPDKGKDITVPTELVNKLLMNGNKDAYIVCSSNPILDTADAYDQAQPPHIQAKKAYLKSLAEISGRKFLVTMEEPTVKSPEPLVFEISERGVSLPSKGIVGAPAILSSPTRRAG